MKSKWHKENSLKLTGYSMQKVGKEITFDILPEKLYVKDKYKRIRIKYYLKDEGEYSFIQKQVC